MSYVYIKTLSTKSTKTKSTKNNNNNVGKELNKFIGITPTSSYIQSVCLSVLVLVCVSDHNSGITWPIGVLIINFDLGVW